MPFGRPRLLQMPQLHSNPDLVALENGCDKPKTSPRMLVLMALPVLFLLPLALLPQVRMYLWTHPQARNRPNSRKSLRDEVPWFLKSRFRFPEAARTALMVQ